MPTATSGCKAATLNELTLLISVFVTADTAIYKEPLMVTLNSSPP